MESATESSMAFPQVSPDSMEDAPASHDGNEKKRKALGPREARGESVEDIVATIQTRVSRPVPF